MEIFGARVSSVTCDGAQTIKTAWVDCGISANSNDKGQITCSMEHPTAKEQNKRILLQGVPYLYKCLTNFIYSRRKLVKAKRKSTKKRKGSNGEVRQFKKNYFMTPLDRTRRALSFSLRCSYTLKIALTSYSSVTLVLLALSSSSRKTAPLGCLVGVP